MDKEREKNKSLNDELIKLKEGSKKPNSEEVQQIITNLKFQEAEDLNKKPCL